MTVGRAWVVVWTAEEKERYEEKARYGEKAQYGAKARYGAKAKRHLSWRPQATADVPAVGRETAKVGGSETVSSAEAAGVAVLVETAAVVAAAEALGESGR